MKETQKRWKHTNHNAEKVAQLKLKHVPISEHTKKETMKRITEPNYDQGSSEGPPMHPHVGVNS